LVENLPTCGLSVEIVSMIKQDSVVAGLMCYFSTLDRGIELKAKHMVPLCVGSHCWLKELHSLWAGQVSTYLQFVSPRAAVSKLQSDP
jgi:hypothetical protein